MFRSIIGFAILAVVAWLALKLIFGIVGSLFGLATTVLTLAVIGFFFYIWMPRPPASVGRSTTLTRGR